MVTIPTDDTDEQLERLAELCAKADEISRTAKRLCEALAERLKDLRAAKGHPERRRAVRHKAKSRAPDC